MNSAQATPARLYALARLVGRLDTADTKRVKDFLQPELIDPTQKATSTVIDEALGLGIITRDDETLHLSDDAAVAITDGDMFRRYLASRLCGVVDPDADNYHLNMYTAWYAAQSADVIKLQKPENLAAKFNRDMYPSNESARAINETKLNAWRNWATYLGWGFAYKLVKGGSDVIIPDATTRVRDILPLVFEGHNDPQPINLFLQKLAFNAPELDDGLLFRMCWEASFGNNAPPSLSLMLTAALLTLHDLGVVKLLREADASASRILHPVQGSPLKSVSHVVMLQLRSDTRAAGDRQ